MDDNLRRPVGNPPHEVYEVDCRSAEGGTKSSILLELILKELRAK